MIDAKENGSRDARENAAGHGVLEYDATESTQASAREYIKERLRYEGKDFGQRARWSSL